MQKYRAFAHDARLAEVPFLGGLTEFQISLELFENLPVSRLKMSKHPLRGNDLYTRELAQSILHIGLLQPIVVRPSDDNNYEVVAGSRRFTACKSLGWEKIQCRIVDVNDKEAFELSLVENIQRMTLNPVEEAEAYKRYVNEFGWGSVKDLASRLEKSSSYISKRMRLLDFPAFIVDKIKSGEISPSMAEELARLDSEEKQCEPASLVCSNRISVSNARSIIQKASCNKEMEESFFFDSYSYGSDSSKANLRSVKAFSKSIAILQNAMNDLANVMEGLRKKLGNV
jgi:ParB family chromosome partitioning protein